MVASLLDASPASFEFNRLDQTQVRHRVVVGAERHQVVQVVRPSFRPCLRHFPMAAFSAPAMAKRIELWPVDRLVPYEKNARTHSPEQISQLQASIAEFGFLNPILVDSKAGIIAGHGRLEAAKELGLAEVPVVVLDHLDAKQRRAYVIADNKLALNAGWDEGLLSAELLDLGEMDFDLGLIGFSEEERAQLMPEVEKLEAMPEVEKLEAMPELADGDKGPVQQMTFTLHDDQVEIVKEAIEKAKAMGPFVDTGNENSNGNAIARVAELFLSWGNEHGLR
jgi:hypothetical protein